MKLSSHKWLLASASALSLIVGGAPNALAQAGGGLSGDVRRENGRSFSGVEVTVLETGATAETGPDGRFRLPNVAPGAYTLVVSFLGQELERRTVNVDADGASVSFALSADTADTIVVTGTRGALASARAQERARDNLSNVVTADDIGNFADQNIAESLQRIPGATIQRSEGEGRTPTIRGLSEGFVTVTVDGTRLGSRTEDDAGDTRSVSLDVFSSDLLNGIEVSKTLLPDQDADSIGGSVNLRTLSAFDRGDNSLALRAEYGFQEKSEDWNPRVSGDFTRLFDLGDGGRLGLAGGVSWQRRNSIVDTFQVDNGLRSTVADTEDQVEAIFDNSGGTYVPGVSTGFEAPDDCDDDPLPATCRIPADGIYSPQAIDQRADPAERERLSANVNLQWRPNSNDEFFFRGTYALFTDDDIRNRQVWDLADGTLEEIIDLTPNSGIFSDVDTEKRFRFSDQEDRLFTVALGGEHARNAWTFDYQLDFSSNQSDIPSVEARFRERDVIVSYSNLSIDGVDFSEFGNDEDNSDPTDPENFEFRFLTAYDFFTEDEIATARFNVQRDFSSRPGFLRFGGKYTQRDRAVDVERFRVESPDDLTLANFPLQDTPGTDLNFLFNPALDPLSAFAWDLRQSGDRVPDLLNADDAVISFARDYTASEEIAAGYAMLKLELLDRLEFIGGARVEHTEWTTSGFRSTVREFDTDVSETLLENLTDAGVTEAEILASSLGERFVEDGGDLEALEGRASAITNIGSNEYTNAFFNLNLRWEPIDNVVIRGSFTQGIQRPNFDEASANGEIRFVDDTDEDDLDGLTTIAEVEDVIEFEGLAGTDGEPLRDPTLDPLLSNNYDLSLSWYPNADTFFQVALFHKDIQDFIVRIVSNSPEDFGFDPDDFDSVQTFINGEDASVTGVELSYGQNYRFLPGLLSGLFASGNVTLAESEQTDGVSGRKLTFQDQADVIGNVSVGWENERFSLRWSGNYVGERLAALNAGFLGLEFAASDLYERERWSMDVNARWSVTEAVQLYFDAININDAEERFFFEGGGLTGPVYGEIENYGSTYQVGVRARF